MGDDAREGGLAQARRAAEQDVIQRFIALARGLDVDEQVLFDAILADEVFEAPRAKGLIETAILLLFLTREDVIFHKSVSRKAAENE